MDLGHGAPTDEKGTLALIMELDTINTTRCFGLHNDRPDDGRGKGNITHDTSTAANDVGNAFGII